MDIAGIVIEFSKEMDRMESIWASNNLSVNEKGPMLLFIGSAAILRGVASVVPGAAHLAAMSATGYLDIANLITGSQAPLDLAEKLKNGDAWISKTFKEQWDGENWYTFVQYHIN